MQISSLHKRKIETVAYRSARARCGGHGIVGSFIAGGDKLIRLNALDLATGHCKRKLKCWGSTTESPCFMYLWMLRHLSYAFRLP